MQILNLVRVTLLRIVFFWSPPKKNQKSWGGVIIANWTLQTKNYSSTHKTHVPILKRKHGNELWNGCCLVCSMQSAAQRRSSSKNLRNCENIADMASRYENWRSRFIFNRLSTSLWHGWEMLRVRLRFRMKGRVWYHLGNWGSWSSISISDLVYTDAVVARPGTSENACMAPPQEPKHDHKKFCLLTLKYAEQ